MEVSRATSIEKDELVIEGIVERILWRDEATHLTIASFKGENVPDFAQNPMFPNSFTAMGIFPRLAISQNLVMKGYWARDKKGRWSFKVKDYKEILPNTEEALIEYLSSGLFKGVGQVTAKAMVDMFGMDILDIIKNDPLKLTKVKGISTTKATAIQKSYQQSEYLEELMLALKPFQISTSKIIKISNVYGAKALEKIKDNPYALCDDVDGIGFKIADSIARVYNKSPNDDFRIRAGIIHTLNESAIVEGHVYLPFEVMISKTQKTLQQGEISGKVDSNDIIRVSIDMNNAKELIIEKDQSVYLPVYYASEVSVGRKVKILLDKKPRAFKYDMEECIAELEEKNKIQYAPKQREAIRAIKDTNLLIITGGPGTGKTTIIKGIIDIYKKNFPGSKIILVAPTGRAAKRMEEATKLEAKTIHRQLEYRPSSDGKIVCERNEYNPIDADLIIIDESSMVDLLLFSTFLKAVRPSTMLIMVGDIDQLPSVGAGSVLKDLIESNKVPVVRLNEIFRQEDTSKIIINASNINNGKTDLEYGDDFIFIREEADNEIPGIVLKCFIDELTRIKDINEIQVLSPFRRKTVNGVDQLNKVLQEGLNKKDFKKPEINYRYTTFRKYDKVMQCKNNYEKEIFNGDLGIIKRIDTNEGVMVVEIDGEEINFFKDELDELQLAYATTIHKSQGSEYDTIIIPLTKQHKVMLQRNLIYTAITRAKKKVILIGDEAALRYAIRNDRVNSRFSKLKSRI